MDRQPSVTERRILVRANELEIGMVVDEPDGWKGTVIGCQEKMVNGRPCTLVELDNGEVRGFRPPTRMLHVLTEDYEF